MLVVVGILNLSLHFIIIITITFIANIIFIISIIIRIFIKSSFLFLCGNFIVWFCFFNFFICLNLSKRLPRYYHLPLFNCGDMKVRD